jgi:hypothetical protein
MLPGMAERRIRPPTCGFCGETFIPSPNARTRQQYCRPSHRQRAYEARQVQTQLAELKAQLRQVRLQNRLLRRLLVEHGVDLDG